MTKLDKLQDAITLMLHVTHPDRVATNAKAIQTARKLLARAVGYDTH